MRQAPSVASDIFSDVTRSYLFVLFTIARLRTRSLTALSIASEIYDYLPVAWLRSLMPISL